MAEEDEGGEEDEEEETRIRTESGMASSWTGVQGNQTSAETGMAQFMRLTRSCSISNQFE